MCVLFLSYHLIASFISCHIFPSMTCAGRSLTLPSIHLQLSDSILQLPLFIWWLHVRLGDSRKYPYHTTDGFKDFRRGGGIHDYGILEAWGGIYDLKSEGMGEFYRWDFWSRKCRVSSWKTLLLWTFVVRK